jgi:hypothetical protein
MIWSKATERLPFFLWGVIINLSSIWLFCHYMFIFSLKMNI